MLPNQECFRAFLLCESNVCVCVFIQAKGKDVETT